MACEVNGMSDARIGEALIKEVIEEELKDMPSEEVPPFTPLAARVESEQEQKLVTQLANMVIIIGDRRDNFKKVADKVFEHGITWERIAVLFYMVEAHLPESVMEILRWTIYSFPELAQSSMQSVSTMSTHNYGLVLIFVAGLAIGSIITWRLSRN
ncbi:hypothetical protein F7725_002849 [Dissostichus mawsoni]|uniref:Apoptosis regulator BAX n=1 Tax=Dissostichus mawsoni TaxID=36200 RepID=A0A7J5Y9W9_DISMA|nr:hypothetical protein F7725_002849 [Dissostichus mawsoni]